MPELTSEDVAQREAEAALERISAPEFLEPEFDVEAGGRGMRLRSHTMVFNPTAFGLTLARHLTPRLEVGQRVCELGLGSGVLSILAGLSGARVTGLDINTHAVEVTRLNWVANRLPVDASDFRHSSLFEALTPEEEGTFDLLWSNPPVLPAAVPRDELPNDREAFEVAGPGGRLVLDGVLGRAQRYLKPGGRALTIATSLQGWERTEELLGTWSEWSVLEEVDLALTDECGPKYIEWWLEQTNPGEAPRVFERDGVWRHKVWFLEARRGAGD